MSFVAVLIKIKLCHKIIAEVASVYNFIGITIKPIQRYFHTM